MIAMNRRAFVHQTAGGIAAAMLARRVGAEDAPANAPAGGGTEPRLRGSFFTLAHSNPWSTNWDGVCLRWKEENWRALMQDMHGIGMDTAICVNAALWGRPFFAGYEKTVGRPMRFGCDDPLGVCVDEADKLGMKMFVGVGLMGKVMQVRDYADMAPPWPDVWFTWNAALAAAIVERYGGHPCFAGLYIPYEIDYRGTQVDLYEKLVRKYLRPAIGKVKLLVSPGNPGVDMPRKQLDALPKLIERTNIDIYAPQDYAGRFAGDVDKALDWVSRQAAALKKVRKPLADMGVELWANCETFDYMRGLVGRGCYGVAPFKRIRRQMEMQAPLVEKLITWIYEGVMSRHTKLIDIGQPGTENLYRDYVAYLKERFG
jgi:hypothetical protein